VKEKLKQLDMKELEATKIRIKAQFMEEGEKSTRYFFSLEKSRKADQTIRVLTKNNLDTVLLPKPRTYFWRPTRFTKNFFRHSLVRTMHESFF